MTRKLIKYELIAGLFALSVNINLYAQGPNPNPRNPNGGGLIDRTLEGSGADYNAPQPPDLAALDRGPLGEGELIRFAIYKNQPLDPKNPPSAVKTLVGMSSDELDILYARSTSGPIPQGFMHGAVHIPSDRGLETIRPLLGEKYDLKVLEGFMEKLWSGKFFDRERRWLLNRKNLAGNSLPPPTKVNDKDMLFPAKLYCGQSLFDSRRESIIIDYKYGIEDWPADLKSDPETDAQRKALDWLGGPRGLDIRDEIRMIRKGLYLGRAYIHGVFGLYFILYNYETTQVATVDDCWIGHQRQLKLGKKQSDYVNN